MKPDTLIKIMNLYKRRFISYSESDDLIFTFIPLDKY